MSTRSEWGKGIDFAEVAEAIGIPTDQVAGMAETRGYWVIYSPDPDELEDTHVAALLRNADGILMFIGHQPAPGAISRLIDGLADDG